MASTTLTVTVTGGVAPFTIQASLYKNGNSILDVTSSHSFTHLFDNLDNGEYHIIIGGFNPAGGSTVFDLTTNNGIMLLSGSDTPGTTDSGVSYFIDFNFTV